MTADGSSSDLAFVRAVRAAARGDATALVEYLRSDRPLSRADRDYLADLHAGEVARPPNRPGLTWSERRDDDELATAIRDGKAELVDLGVLAGVAQLDAAEEFKDDPRARRRTVDTLAKLATRDPYRALITEARYRQAQLVARGLSEVEAARNIASWAAADYRAAGRGADEILRHLVSE